MRTVKQLAREFWLPLVIALAWATYVSWKDFSVATVVTTFAGSFFLASWAIGQFLRVRRQHSIEDSFASTEKHFADLREKMFSVVTIAGELQAQAKTTPSLEPVLKQLSDIATAANTEAQAANTAFSHARTMARNMDAIDYLGRDSLHAEADYGFKTIDNARVTYHDNVTSEQQNAVIEEIHKLFGIRRGLVDVDLYWFEFDAITMKQFQRKADLIQKRFPVVKYITADPA